MVWREGETFRFKLKIFCFLSLGAHTILVIKFDEQSFVMYTEEGNKAVPCWNHTITLEKIDAPSSRYTDEVELYAGWKTLVVSWWSRMFYRHRQRKWKKLLKRNL